MASMTPLITVKSDLEATVTQWCRVTESQMPFATAVALTRTAKAGMDEIVREMPSLIDRPTPFALRGFRLSPATKQRLVAWVEFRGSMGSDGARDYLAPIVYGGDRKLKAFERSLARIGLLPSGYAALPGSAAKMDAYGNMARGQIVQMLSYFKAFGEVGYSANMTDKKRSALSKGNRRTGQRGVEYFIGRPGGGRLPLGIWQRTNFGAAGSAIKPVILFLSKPTYRQQLDVPGISRRVVEGRFPIELQRALREAKLTAIPKQQMSLL